MSVAATQQQSIALQPATSGSEARRPGRDADEIWSRFNSALSGFRQRVRGNGASDLVLADLLEDDLRQARVAVRRLEGWLDETTRVLGDADVTARELVAVGDPAEAEDAVAALEALLPHLRRRIGQAALRVSRR